MARDKTRAMTKEEKDKRAKDLADRKKRDAEQDFIYTPCGGICGESVRWRFPRNIERTQENIEILAPKHCGSEECQRAFMEGELERRRQAQSLPEAG